MNRFESIALLTAVLCVGACRGEVLLGLHDGGASGSGSAGPASAGDSSGSSAGASAGSESGSAGSSYAGSSAGSGSSYAGSSAGSGSGCAGSQMATAGSTCASPLAAYEFVVNGVVQTPLSCPHTSGQFPVPTGQSGAVCDTMTLPADPPPQCAGITSVAIANAGTEPLAYNAEPVWDPSNGGVVPGVQFGNPYELAGVLNPGQQVDITSAYVGGIVAVLGATAPFSNANSGNYIADEGTIPWPAGVFGGGGTMYVTEIEIATACGGNSNVW